MARRDKAPSWVVASRGIAAVDSAPGRERVTEIQRMRILVAMAEVSYERGAGEVSVAHVVERAGISRRTFYELFRDREECFLATFQEAVRRAERYVAGAYDPGAQWAARVRSAVEALLGYAESEPSMARLAVVESLSGGAKALELRSCVIGRCVAAVEEGRREMNGSSSATSLTGEGVVGGIASVIHGQLVSRGSGGLVELTNSLMSMIVLPYRGPVAARKELERPVSRARGQVASAQHNPLKDLDMRLTYRTVRVIAAVAANPGSSNRAIGDASGIGDQGQVSKLLARVEKLGLVAREKTRATRGATNSWTLTGRGEEVASVIATQVATS